MNPHRKLFQLEPGTTLLNNAGVAPIPLSAQNAAAQVLRTQSAGGTASLGPLLEQYSTARARLAKLCGSRAEDTSFHSSCAAAISQVAFGLKLQPGDEILIGDREYPSNAYPWHVAATRTGASLQLVPSETRLLDAIGPNTRVVAVSWVQYRDGHVTDLLRLSKRCRDVGAWLVVDVIQGLGCLPLQPMAVGADAVCGGAHKWLCGPLGLGFLALRPDLAQELAPIAVGTFTFGTPDEAVDFSRPMKTDHFRFEPGTPPLLSAITLGAAIQSLEEASIERGYLHSLALSEALRAELRPLKGLTLLEPQQSESIPRSPIVTVRVSPQIHAPLVARLNEARIVVAARFMEIRISPHAFNEKAEIQRVAEVFHSFFGSNRASF